MDETLPLLPDQERDLVVECDEHIRRDIVDFDPTGDAENPTEWPAAYKWGIVLLLALMAFTMYGAIFSPDTCSRLLAGSYPHTLVCSY